MRALIKKAWFSAVCLIGFVIVAVDFTSWLMSAVVELVLVGAMLALIWIGADLADEGEKE